MQIRRHVLAALAALAAVATAAPGHAQSWPQRPVKLIIPYAAGGNADTVARIIAQALGDALGQPFVPENRPGATGAIAADSVARAPADGYTLFLAPLPQIAMVPVLNKTAYDPVKSFAPISMVGTNPFVLTVHPGLPVRTLADFISYAKSQPDKVNYAAVGVGGLTHLSMALFANRAGIDLMPVMYRGGGTAPISDLIAGHIPAYFTSLSDVVPHMASGAVRPLAVSSEQRAPQAPNIPTFIESGFPGFKIINWVGLMAPAGTPKEIVDLIARETARAVKDSKVAERLAANGVDAFSNTPEQFAAQIAIDIAVWAEAIKIAGLQGSQ
jgi:tripartite-type tricarboxylate transporter receptor subunit TctC